MDAARPQVGNSGEGRLGKMERCSYCRSRHTALLCYHLLLLPAAPLSYHIAITIYLPLTASLPSNTADTQGKCFTPALADVKLTHFLSAAWGQHVRVPAGPRELLLTAEKATISIGFRLNIAAQR